VTDMEVVEKKFYGWISLSGAILVYFSFSGVIYYSYGVFLPYLSIEFEFNKMMLSGPYSTFLLIGGLLGPLAGISVKRYGVRENIVFGNFVAVVGLAGMYLVRNLWHLYLVFGFLLGVGLAFGYFVPTMTLVNDWFVRKKSMAMSLLLVPGSIGGFVFPPLISWLISNVGWRTSWVYLSVIHFTLSVLLAGIIIRNKPEHLGQYPDGALASPNANLQNTNLSTSHATKADWPAKDALLSPTLWYIIFFGIAEIVSLSALVIHLVSYLCEVGFSPILASTALGILVGATAVGKLVYGILGSRFQARYLASTCVIQSIFGMIMLITTRSLSFIYLGSILCGIGVGGSLVLKPSIIGEYFGQLHFPKIVGFTLPMVLTIEAASPVLVGFIYDRAGSYIIAFVIIIAILVCGLLCAFIAKPPKPYHQNRRQDGFKTDQRQLK